MGEVRVYKYDAFPLYYCVVAFSSYSLLSCSIRFRLDLFIATLLKMCLAFLMVSFFFECVHGVRTHPVELARIFLIEKRLLHAGILPFWHDVWGFGPSRRTCSHLFNKGSTPLRSISTTSRDSPRWGLGLSHFPASALVCEPW